MFRQLQFCDTVLDRQHLKGFPVLAWAFRNISSFLDLQIQIILSNFNGKVEKSILLILFNQYCIS